jgi:short subunit dehydrogenase-like uncharacterized protein
MEHILIYGAYGYTGQLITEMALEQSLAIILGGRNQEKLKKMADKFDLEYRVFGLDNHDEVVDQLKNIQIVVNCAGPFSWTAEKMVKACLVSRTDYLDITGEIDVFESLQSYDQQAKTKDIMVMPGTGFDVVPTDCVANYLSKKLPDADRLELAFHGMGKTSRGTTKSQVERLKVGGAIREDGILKVVPMLSKSKEMVFTTSDGKEITKGTYLIPWGDVSTAYFSTGIPNIEVYQHFPKSFARMAKSTRYIRWLLKLRFYEKFMTWMQLKLYPPLKSGEIYGKGTMVRGTVSNDKGESVSVRLNTEDGYLFTARSTVTILKKMLSGEKKPGYQTPASCFGYDLILEIPNTSEFIEFSE